MYRMGKTRKKKLSQTRTGPLFETFKLIIIGFSKKSTRYKFIKSPYLALEARLMSLYFDTKQYNMCLKLGQRLYSELKKLDDKALLVEIQLTESKVSHQLWFITIFPTFRPIIHLAIYKIHEHHWRPPGPLQIQFTVHPEPKPTWTCNLVFYTLLRITIGKLLSGNIYGFYLF